MRLEKPLSAFTMLETGRHLEQVKNGKFSVCSMQYRKLNYSEKNQEQLYCYKTHIRKLY